MTGWHPTDKECSRCGAVLWAYWDCGVISHYKFEAPIEGCCCEVKDELN